MVDSGGNIWIQRFAIEDPSDLWFRLSEVPELLHLIWGLHLEKINSLIQIHQG